MEDARFNLFLSGRIKSDFDLPEVAQSFAQLHQITLEKAEVLISSQRILKKDLDESSALSYKRKLESIGIVVVMEPTTEPKPKEQTFGFELEPTEEEILASQSSLNRDAYDNQAKLFVVCPKCQFKQQQPSHTNSSAACSHSGVVFHKLNAKSMTLKPMDTSRPTPLLGEAQAQDNTLTTSDTLTSKILIVAAISAFLGALVWKVIVVATGYEVGLIAWGIGGVVGFAAVMSGARGESAGMICSVFVLLAIVGGKYWAISSLQNDWGSKLESSTEAQTEEFRQVYFDNLEMARAYSKSVKDDISLRNFIVLYNYSESQRAEYVTNEEINYFKDYVVPGLISMAEKQPDFKEWLTDSFQQEVKQVSAFDILQESFNFMDVIFLLLGITTAFKLVNRNEN